MSVLRRLVNGAYVVILGGGQHTGGPNRARAEQHFYAWLVHCADAGVTELERLARNIDCWRGELLAYFDTDRISNGTTEAVNP
jgi:transposase